MLDKLKMWLMTEENKQKYLLEKEKSERETKRRETDEAPPKNKKEKASKEAKSNSKVKNNTKEKPKKQGGLFGKKTDIESIETDDDNLITEEVKETFVEDKPKKVVVVKRKSDNNDMSNEDSLVEKSPFDNIDNSYFNKKEGENSINELDDNSDIEETSEDISEDTNEDTSEDTNEENLNLDVISELTQSEKPFLNEEDRKKELLAKKKDEEYKYLTILLDLPPTTDEAYFIRRAFEAGIPEWFLRSKGYIEDGFENIKEEKHNFKDEKIREELSVEELAVKKLKEEFNSDIEGDDILDDVMEELLESEGLENEVFDEFIKSKEENISVSDVSSDNLFEVDLSDIDNDDVHRINKPSENEESKVPNLMKDLLNEEIKALEKNKEEELKKNSSVIISELRNRMKNKKVEEDTSIDVADKVLSSIPEISKVSEIKNDDSLNPSIDMSELKIKARQAIKAAVKESVNVKVESDNETQAMLNVEERLKSLKRKREVLSSNGNNILVKEDIEIGEGKVVTNY